jgi:hypothetical protein
MPRPSWGGQTGNESHDVGKTPGELLARTGIIDAPVSPVDVALAAGLALCVRPSHVLELSSALHARGRFPDVHPGMDGKPFSTVMG